MSGWLRNLQGQLTELATEVLNEATEEVADPDTELQVVKKQAAESETRLSAAMREIERLQANCTESEERAEATQLQIDALSDRYRGLLEAREADVRHLQTQLQQLQVSADDGGNASHHGFPSSSPPLSPAQDVQLRDELKQLKAEVAHWKNVVKQSESGGDAQQELVKLRQELSQLTDKHQAEIASLQHAHFENTRSLRTQYEMRIASLQQSATASDLGSKPPTEADDGWNAGWDDDENWKGGGSLSEYSAPSLDDLTSQKTATSELLAQLEDMQRKYDQLQTDKAGLIEEKERLADRVQKERHHNLAAINEVDSLKHEAVVRDLDDARNKIVELELQVSSLQQNLETLDQQHQDVIDHLRTSQKSTLSKTEQQLLEANQALAEAQKVNEKLKAENQELTSAYNDLNDEYENHKAEFGSVVTSNRDLNTRIESLKADLIEYEEKYERCKGENAATAKQLDVLTSEFDRLKFGFEAARSATSAADAKLAGEVERLQEELSSSQEQREKLMSDVGGFNDSIAKIDSELSGLRSSNRELMDENRELRASIGSLGNLKDVFSDTEGELHELRTQLKQFQLEQLKIEHALRQELQDSLERVDDLRKQLAESKSRAVTAESALVRYRSVVGEDAANIVEMKHEGEKKKANSSGGASDGSGESNNGWDRLGEWEQEEGAVGGAAVAARTSSIDRPISQPISQMELQMREALAAVTEKTEECEELNKKLMGKTQELQERDELLQQAFTELKGLECQLSESRERESNLRINVQRLTVETARKDEEIQAIRDGLEAAQSAQTDLAMQLEGAERHLAEDRRKIDAIQELQSVSDFAQRQSEEIVRLEKDRAETEAIAAAAQQRAIAAEADLVARDARIARLSSDAANLDSQLEVLADQKAELESEVCSLQETNSALLTQIEELQGQLKRLAQTMQEAQRARELDMERLSLQLTQTSATAVSESDAEKDQLVQKLANAESMLSALGAEKQQLIALVQQKHEESVRYHGEAQKQAQTAADLQGRMQFADQTVASLQQQMTTASTELTTLANENARLSAEHARLVAMLDSSAVNANSATQAARELAAQRERADQLTSQLRMSEEERTKATKEMERLREHLLMIEDNYTRDAVAAEERETELRQRLRLLEVESHATSESVRDSAHQYQDTLGDLGVQLESMTGQRDAALLELTDMQRQLMDSKKALSSLQGVLRDMERESGAQSSAELDRVRVDNDSLRTAIQKLSEHLEQLKNANAESETRREQLERQMRDVSTTLSQREDDLRAVEERLAEAQTRPATSGHAQRQVDQEVLRNLFLSYFTAPNDKKREVAHLLASVLGFSAEEIKKMDGGALSGWLGFLRGGGGGTSDSSITEQFIKFLETESTAVASTSGKPHALPTDRASSVPVGSASSGRSTPAFPFGHQRPSLTGQSSLSTDPFEMPALNSPLRPPVDRTSDALKEMLQD